MRPKLIALIAVSAVALVGCASNEIPTVSPAEQSAQQAAVDAELKKSIPDPIEVAEEKFAKFAIARADVHSAKVAPDPDDSVKALHDYCENGTDIKVSKTDALNENLEFVADTTYCDLVKAK